MLVPGDLVTDADLQALDSGLSDVFGDPVWTTLKAKRHVAVVDWLAAKLEAAGYAPDDHRVRHSPKEVYGYTASAYTDYATEAGDSTAEDVPLATIWTTPASDALYVGYDVPFTGLYVALTGSTVNANASVLTVKVWDGAAWAAVAGQADGTIATSGKTLSRGGRITWARPEDWVPRTINDGALLFWVQVTVSAALTASVDADQILPIVRSRLTHPTALYALSLLYREGAGSRRGAYLEQANDYLARAEAGLAAVLPLIGDEFDTDASGATSTGDAVAGAGGAIWTVERG